MLRYVGANARSKRMVWRPIFRSIAKERKAIAIAYAWDQFHVFARCTRLDVPMVQVMCEFDGGIPHIGCARRAARAHGLGHDEENGGRWRGR